MMSEQLAHTKPASNGNDNSAIHTMWYDVVGSRGTLVTRRGLVHGAVTYQNPEESLHSRERIIMQF